MGYVRKYLVGTIPGIILHHILPAQIYGQLGSLCDCHINVGAQIKTLQVYIGIIVLNRI